MSAYPKKKLAQLVLQQCLANTIENVVISPGSRNAPLTIGFVNHSKIKAFSVVDERSAGFFALGMAQQKQEPVVLLCTSGSALLNYYPAVAEAFYSKIPLVIISADRPQYLIDIGDGQTVRQENVFKNHILFSANLKESQSPAELSDSLSEKEERLLEKDNLVLDNELIQKALKTAIEQKGPVHINVPFDEPLYETIDSLYDFDFKVAAGSRTVIENSLLDEVPLPVEELQKFADVWNRSKKKMVLLGAHFPDDLIQTQLRHLIKDPTVLVFTETTSNVSNAGFINNIDQLIFPLTHDEFEQLKPDILITFGGMVVSKKIKQFLRNHPPSAHWHIDKHRAMDTFHCLMHHFKVSPQLFFSQFFFLTLQGQGNYQEHWLQMKQQRKIKHELFVKAAGYSDFLVFDKILKSLPAPSHLQLSNSSIIRYSQLFDLNPGLQVFCNRGTSGIDGSTSTAIGAATIHTGQTVFISGDISFFYDSNALWNKYIPKNFRIILINNGGGGIFRFIPGPKSTDALDYFETPHNLNASQLCKMYGLTYRKAGNEEELQTELNTFYQSADQAVLLEVFTPSKLNDGYLKSYFNSLKL